MYAFDRQTDGQYAVVVVEWFNVPPNRRTDRRTEFSSLDRVCIPCSAVKIFYRTSTSRFDSILSDCAAATVGILEVGLLSVGRERKIHLRHFVYLDISSTSSLIF